MNILTILIFSGDRISIKNLINVIVKLKKKNIDIKIVDWSKNKKILNKKKNIYFHYNKIIKNFNVQYQIGNFEFKYKRFINKFNSRYILMIGDDDRIHINNFKKIFKYLNSNFSGITISFKIYKNKENFKEEEEDNFSSHSIKSFNIDNDLNKIGFISCQIVKTDLINKIFEDEKKNLLTTQFPHNFIILKIIKKFNNWKVTNLKCIYRHTGNIDLFVKRPKTILTRLKSEYEGYFIPLILNYSYFSKEKFDKIYKRIFFNNIISWLFLSLKYCGKKKTFQTIKKCRKIIKEPILIKITLIFFYICPIFILNFIKILRRNFIK